MDWITGMEYWTGMTLDLIENKISKPQNSNYKNCFTKTKANHKIQIAKIVLQKEN